MPPTIPPQDIVIYVYEDAGAPVREERLPLCAAHYGLARGLEQGDFRVELGAGGKPYFFARPDAHFSVSHSGRYWLAAFHGAPLGLDIQKHTQRDYVAIAKRWYHPSEYAAVTQQGPGCFFDIWSAKESVCKMSGAGINSSFPGFSVVSGTSVAPHSNGAQLRRIELFNGYSLYLAAEHIGNIHIESHL